MLHKRVSWCTIDEYVIELLDLSATQLDGDLNFLCGTFDDSSPQKAFGANCHGGDPDIRCDCCNLCCFDVDDSRPAFGCFPAGREVVSVPLWDCFCTLLL